MNAFTLARLNLQHQRLRTLISLAGVAFAALLIFTQLGFLGAVDRTASLLFDHLDFDLLLTSREYLDLNTPQGFPRLRIYQAGAVSGVESVRPFSVCLGLWRGPRSQSSPRVDSRRWNIMILCWLCMPLGKVREVCHQIFILGYRPAAGPKQPTPRTGPGCRSGQHWTLSAALRC